MTGKFTVPPGGAGMYYFSVYLSVDDGEFAWVDITVNGDTMCRSNGDNAQGSSSDYAQSTCSGLAKLIEGK